MTRRALLPLLAAPPGLAAASGRVSVPVHRIIDGHARIPADWLRRFWWGIWPECARDFSRGGIDLKTTDGAGEVRHTAADRPIFLGLRRGAINLVVTTYLPLYWDDARALPGVTTIIEGHPVCTIALAYAHGNRAPFLSVNTCTHELLHVLLQDVFVTHPKWYQSGGREVGADYHATLLWLFGDGAAVRKPAREYVKRLGAARGSGG